MKVTRRSILRALVTIPLVRMVAPFVSGGIVPPGDPIRIGERTQGHLWIIAGEGAGQKYKIVERIGSSVILESPIPFELSDATVVVVET